MIDRESDSQYCTDMKFSNTVRFPSESSYRAAYGGFIVRRPKCSSAKEAKLSLNKVKSELEKRGLSSEGDLLQIKLRLDASILREDLGKKHPYYTKKQEKSSQFKPKSILRRKTKKASQIRRETKIMTRKILRDREHSRKIGAYDADRLVKTSEWTKVDTSAIMGMGSHIFVESLPYHHKETSSEIYDTDTGKCYLCERVFLKKNLPGMLFCAFSIQRESTGNCSPFVCYLCCAVKGL